ncbi:hypothetical protein LA080_006580 [Diaporthe eres]|nr:hypothetical protein LA080_006580 [Diaporthe eres]
MQPCLELIQITSDESVAAAKIAQRDMILNDACQGGAGPKSAYAVFEDAKDSRLILRLVLTATPKPDCMVYGSRLTEPRPAKRSYVKERDTSTQMADYGITHFVELGIAAYALYGPVVRIAPDELTTTLPEAWKDLYASKPLLLKDPHSQTPPLNGAHSLFTAEGDTHRRIRGVLSNSFSDKALRTQAPIIEKYAYQLIARVRREAGQGEGGAGGVDLTKLYGYAAFDTITDLSLGESLARGLEDMNEHSWIQGYFFHAKFSAVRIALSRFSPLDAFLGLFLLSVTRKARQRNWRVITGALDRRMARNDAQEKRSDLLTPLVDRLDESQRVGITKAEMMSNGLAFVIAGTQLNTNLLSTATYLLLRHPDKLERLVEEVRGRFSDDNEITVQATHDLPYLDAVLNETLRIRHPTPINLPRIVSQGGCLVNGQRVPSNAIVGINLQNIQNSSTLWVEPRQFHPERFLPAKDPRYDARFDGDVKEAFAPFSVGPRNCVGYKYVAS